MTSTILFLCPHHAAKSVIAEAYFNRLAGEVGLDWRGTSGGTEPDENVSPIVVDLLGKRGIDVSQHQPRRVTADALHSATRIVSMGCTPQELDIDPARVEQWTDIPPVSQHPEEASEVIATYIRTLVNQLLAQ